MHKRLVANIVSRIFFVVSFIMVIPLMWAIYDDMHSQEVFAFVVTIIGGLIISSLCHWMFHTSHAELEKLNPKDGLAIVGLSWVFLSAFGALPFFLSGAIPNYIDAFFETTSGFTTTGASILVNIEALPRGLLFWRSLTHWLGGMGIIVLYLALLPAIGSSAVQLYRAEIPGPTAERIEPRIKETAKVLWGVYFFISLTETVLLMFGGMSLFDALCHTFGTMATGGFSTKNASIAAFGAYIQWVIVFFMFLAGTNFMLHYQALRGNLKAYLKSEEFFYYLFLVFGLIPVFALVLKGFSHSAAPFRESVFQIVSILTTTGYTTADFNAYPQILKFVLLGLMFIGGCAGSTGGSMKVIRFFLTIKISVRSMVQTIFPNAVMPIRVDSNPISNKAVMDVLTYFVIFILLFFIGAILLAITDSCDLITAFSASIASLGNIGPGLGRVGAASNYAWISPEGKLILTFLMLAGRLELYSILILFLPAIWKK